MKRYFLTGATGHIGNFVLNELIKKSKNVICLVQPLDNFENILEKNVNVLIGDIRNRDFILNNIKNNDVVIHLAGIISISNKNEKLIYDVNYQGTKNIADACLKAGAKLIYTSSVHVLKANKGQIIDENVGFNIKSKRGPYEHTKSLATQYIFDLFKKGLNGVVLYPSAIIGPNDTFVGEVSHALTMIYNKKMPAYIKGGYSFVDVRDVAHAIVTCSENEKINKQGYILSNEYISIKNLVKLIYDHYSYGKIPLYCPTFLVYLGLPFIALYAKIAHKTPIFTKIMLKTVLSNGNFTNDKAKKDLGFSPRPLIESITDQIDWLKESHDELFTSK